VYVSMQLSGRKVNALLDTGCESSVVERCLIPDAELKPTTQKLYAVNAIEIPLLGETTVDIVIGQRHCHWTISR